MNTIIIIIVGCWLLYKTGFSKHLLQAATLQPVKPYKKEYQKKPIKPPATNKTIIVYESRTQLEARAANIMTAAGYTFDVWQKVRAMTNNELNEIITQGY
jgi:rhodanese-related sulfurtransferase